MCLQFAQTFYGAPVKHRSAWHAWLATKKKFGPEVPIPTDVPVLLWYSHWGRYDDELGQYGDNPRDPYFGNWGHVTPIIPGEAIYTSPWYVNYGQERYSSIAEVQRIFKAEYVGWSLDINGLDVAEIIPPKPLPPTVQEEEYEMEPLYITDDVKKNPYWCINQVTGKRRKISKAEWAAIVDRDKAVGAKPILTEVATAELSKIPTD